MHFELTDEQRMIQQMTRDFAEKELIPIAPHLDREHRYPKEAVAKMAELGLMGIAIDPDYGGSGMDHVSYVIAMEEISRGCASTGVIMSVNNSLVCDPINKFGNEEQKKKFLTPLASGQKLGCFALSEPGTGSDAAAQKCMIVRDGDDYVINGVKNWITNGKEADTCVLIGMSDRSKGHKGITAIVVEKGAPGFSIGKVEDKLGICGSSTTELVFEDCRVPAANRLGEEGDGFKVAMTTLDGGRIGIAAQALGIARASLEEATAYSKERVAFGGPIANLQAIQFMLADMATKLHAARLLTYRAASLKDQGVPFSKEAAMAKLYASEASSWIATKGLQIHGGYGYVKEFNAERHLRDARITEIYEGTSEIQRMVIAANVLKEFARRN